MSRWDRSDGAGVNFFVYYTLVSPLIVVRLVTFILFLRYTVTWNSRPVIRFIPHSDRCCCPVVVSRDGLFGGLGARETGTRGGARSVYHGRNRLRTLYVVETTILKLKKRRRSLRKCAKGVKQNVKILDSGWT